MCVHNWIAVSARESDYSVEFVCDTCGSAARLQLVAHAAGIAVQSAVLTPGPLVTTADLKALAHEFAAAAGLSGPSVEHTVYGPIGSNRAVRRAEKARRHRKRAKVA